MLPSSLLITRTSRDKIRPVYAQITQRNLDMARLLIQTYRDFVGKKKGQLNETIDRMEESLGHDYRYVRALSTLLDRRCQLQPKTTVSAIKVRRQIFKTTHRKGFPTTSETRQVILRQVARELDLTVKDVEESFYADLEDELVLTDFQPIDAEALIKQYNLSLTQTLLFYSTELVFTAAGKWQQMFRQIKWLGLIYTIWRTDSEYAVKVDGPASLFKLSRRYGTSMAKLLPILVQNQEWTLKAKILRRKGERRLLNLELTSKEHGGIMRPLYRSEENEGYDSQVEDDFARRFRTSQTGWTLTREPEPIPVGKRVMIPDFGFQKSSLQVFLEVVGFWTPRYLQEKVRKLSQLRDVDMIVAADRSLACQKLDALGKKLNVVYYKRKIPLKPIIVHLRAREEALMKDQIDHLRPRTLPIHEPVVEAKELAERLGVLEDAVKEVFLVQEFPGYVRLWDMLIKETKLAEIRERLKRRLSEGELTLGEASRIIEDSGGRRPTSILNTLGYEVEWHGIDPNSAIICERKK